MADQRLTDKTSMVTIADGDLFHSVDISDTTANPNGTSKKTLFSLIKSTLKSYFDDIYQAIGANVEPTNGGTFTGVLSLSNSVGTYYNSYNLSVSGAITFSLSGDQKIGAFDIITILSDGITPIASEANLTSVFGSRQLGLPSTRILPSGTYDLVVYYFPTGAVLQSPFTTGSVPNVPLTATNVNISGNEIVGQQLTGSYTYVQNDGGPESGTTVQWYRADDQAGLNEVAIVGATSSIYTVVLADENKYLRFGVTPSDGVTTGAEVFSVYTSQVAQPANIPPTANPVTFTGTETVGLTLSGAYVYNDAEGDPESGTTFQWYRADDNGGLNEIPIGAATLLNYTLQINDETKFIRLGVTPANSNGVGNEFFSPYSNAITAPSAVTILNDPANALMIYQTDNVSKLSLSGSDVVGFLDQSGNSNDAPIAISPVQTPATLNLSDLSADFVFGSDVQVYETPLQSVDQTNFTFYFAGVFQKDEVHFSTNTTDRLFWLETTGSQGLGATLARVDILGTVLVGTRAFVREIPVSGNDGPFQEPARANGHVVGVLMAKPNSVKLWINNELIFSSSTTIAPNIASISSFIFGKINRMSGLLKFHEMRLYTNTYDESEVPDVLNYMTSTYPNFTPNDADKPTVSGLSISGTPSVGSTLTANFTFNPGASGGTAGDYYVQWSRRSGGTAQQVAFTGTRLDIYKNINTVTVPNNVGESISFRVLHFDSANRCTKIWDFPSTPLIITV